MHLVLTKYKLCSQFKHDSGPHNLIVGLIMLNIFMFMWLENFQWMM